MITPPGYQPQPRRKLYGLPLIITGAVVAVGAFALLESVTSQYHLCASGLGVLAQSMNHAAAVNCMQDADGYHASAVAIAIGLVTAVAGVIRLFWKGQQPPVPPASHQQPQPPTWPGSAQPPSGWQ
jgi:hypothetical protein